VYWKEIWQHIQKIGQSYFAIGNMGAFSPPFSLTNTPLIGIKGQ